MTLVTMTLIPPPYPVIFANVAASVAGSPEISSRLTRVVTPAAMQIRLGATSKHFAK
jgi:hypothetical protein